MVDALNRELAFYGFDIWVRADNLAALRSASEICPDLLLLDARDSPASKVQLCRSLREIPETADRAIVALAAPEDEGTRLGALEAGADDSFPADLSVREMVLRLRAAVRRFDSSPFTRVLRYGDIELDLEKYKVRRAGVPIPLSTMQIKVLRHLMQHPTIVFSRQELLRAVWKDEGHDNRAVDALLTRMRRMLNSVGGPNVIRAVRGVGYALDTEWVDAGRRPGADHRRKP